MVVWWSCGGRVVVVVWCGGGCEGSLVVGWRGGVRRATSRVLRVLSMFTWCLVVSVASVAVRVGVRSVAGCGAVRRGSSRMSGGALCALCAPQTLYLHFALKCHYIVCRAIGCVDPMESSPFACAIRLFFFGCLFRPGTSAETRRRDVRDTVRGTRRRAPDVGLPAQRRRRGRVTLLWRGRAASRTRRAGLVVLPGLDTGCRRQVQVQRSEECRDPEAASHRQHLVRACSPAWAMCHPWQGPSSAPTPPPGSSALPGRVAGPLGAQPLPRTLELAAPKARPLTPLRSPRRSTRRASGVMWWTRRRTWSSMAT